MSSITRLSVGESDANPSRKRFRSHSGARKPDPAVLDRQARFTLAVFRFHERREDALAFLNDYDDRLQGRPVQIAGETEAGLAAALSLLAAMVDEGTDTGSRHA